MSSSEQSFGQNLAYCSYVVSPSLLALVARNALGVMWDLAVSKAAGTQPLLREEHKNNTAEGMEPSSHRCRDSKQM